MSSLVNKDTGRKAVKISKRTWQSISHEAITRDVQIIDLVEMAWAVWMDLPEARRDKIVRENA